MTREIQVTIDCADPAALAEFWAEVLGSRIQQPPNGFDTWDAALAAMGIPPERRNDASALVDPDGSGPRIYFQRVPEGKAVKNRVHLDVRAAPGLTGDLTRLEPAPPLNGGHIVMADPEGNEFCLD